MAATISLSTAWAIPTLQLDIAGGEYVGGDDETIYSVGGVFNLYALLYPEGKKQGANAAEFGDDFWLSVALVPKTSTDSEFGSFSISQGGTPLIAEREYGSPPVGSVDLANHGVFETYFWEYPVTFVQGDEFAPYNTQDQAGAAGTSAVEGEGMYWSMFNVDATGLAEGYNLHFDLYTYGAHEKSGKEMILDFAPFSHDAQSRVPDGGTTLALLGLGLIGLTAVQRRVRR